MAVSKRRPLVGNDGCSCSMPGVWRAVAHNSGAAVIYHAPKACTHITGSMDLYDFYHDLSSKKIGVYEYTVPLFSTQIEEKHTIFGGGDLLGNCIDFVVEKCNPNYIIVANSCVSGVIGDDSEGISRDKEYEHGIPIICINERGFLDGEYYGGFYETTRQLIERFMDPVPEKKDAICILGEKGGPNGRHSKELKTLFEGFGIEVVDHFPSYSSMEDIKNIGKCRWIFPVGGTENSFSWMLKLASHMSNKIGATCFSNDYPIGIKETFLWIDKMGAFLERESQIEVVKKYNEDLLNQIKIKFSQKLNGLHVVLVLGNRLEWIEVQWIIELIDFWDMVLDGILFLENISEKDMETYLVKWGIDESIPVYREIDGVSFLENTDIILTTVELDAGDYKQLFLPMIPPIGIGGLIFLCQKLFRLACYRRNRGVIINGW